MPIAELRRLPLVSGFCLANAATSIRHGRILWMGRISQQLTRSDLAQKLGVSREAIRLWEQGKRWPDEDTLSLVIYVLKLEAQGFTIQEVNPHKRLGLLLQMARVGQGMSLDHLALRLDVCRETLRFWELGKRSPDGIMLKRLAEALNQDVRLFWS